MRKNDTEQKRSFIINFVYYLIIVAIALVLLKYILPLLWPVVIAFIIAYGLQRPINFVYRKLHIKKKFCGLFLALLFFATIGSLISLVGIEAVTGMQKLVQNLPDFYDRTVEPVMLELFSRIENAAVWNNPQVYDLIVSVEEQFLRSLGELVTNISSGAVGLISGLASSLPMMFIKLVLLIISTVFVSMDYDKLVSFCMNQLNDKTRDLVYEVKRYVVGTLFVCIRSYALIMSITFVELSIGLTVIDIDHAVLIAFCIAVFDILPVLGTGGIMIPWAVINVVVGNYSLALSLFIVYIIITIVRNILEPKIVGSQLGLHPVVTLASLFAGAQLLGVIGLFGFPIFLSLLRHLNDEGIIHVFKMEKTS